MKKKENLLLRTKGPQGRKLTDRSRLRTGDAWQRKPGAGTPGVSPQRCPPALTVTGACVDGAGGKDGLGQDSPVSTSFLPGLTSGEREQQSPAPLSAPRVPVVHVQRLQVALGDSGQLGDDVAEAGGRGHVHAGLPAPVVVVDDGRAPVVAQDDGAQGPVAALEDSQRSS